MAQQASPNTPVASTTPIPLRRIPNTVELSGRRAGSFPPREKPGVVPETGAVLRNAIPAKREGGLHFALKNPEFNYRFIDRIEKSLNPMEINPRKNRAFFFNREFFR
jgi:hypothetical protein